MIANARGRRRVIRVLRGLPIASLLVLAVPGWSAAQTTVPLGAPTQRERQGQETLEGPPKPFVPLVQEEEESVPIYNPKPLEQQEQDNVPIDYSKVTLTLSNVDLKCSTLLSKGELDEIYAEFIGKTIPVTELFRLRHKIQQRYRERGYFLTRVILKAQELPTENAVPQLIAVEGYISRALVQGDVGRVQSLVERMAKRLEHGEAATLAAVERQLLLIQDIPGISARARFAAAPTPPPSPDPKDNAGCLSGLEKDAGMKASGASVLTIDVVRTPYAGFASIDNRGAGFAGPWQGAIGFSANSFTGLGDRTEAYFFTSPDREQRFGQVALSTILTADGLSLRVQGGYGPSYPGGLLGEAGFASDVTTAGVQLTLPIHRRRRANLWLSTGFSLNDSHIKLSDGNDGYLRVTESHLRMFNLSLRGNIVDGWKGLTDFTVGIDQGMRGLGATPRESDLTARPDSRPDFTRLTGRLSRRQALETFGQWTFDAELSLAGQVGFNVLPPSQKGQLGGIEFGRGYYYGLLTGDRSLAGSVELSARRALEQWRPGAGVTPYLFYDHGMVWNIAIDDPGRRFLHSAGAGLRLDLGRHLTGEIEYARRLVTNPSRTNEADLDPSRVFVRLVARY